MLKLNVFILGLLLSITAKAQQAWTDYTVNIPFAESYVFNPQFSYQTNIDEGKWKSYGFEPGVERSINDRFDVMFSVALNYTSQIENYDTKEIKPLIGLCFHITPNNRVLLRTLARIEHRSQYDGQSWSHNPRTRLRLESIIPLNRHRFSDHNVWYVLADAEVFWVGQQLDERYANQARYRIGLGYRPSYSWRFELLYINQQSKNTIDDDISESTNILRFRVKHFLNKKKPITWHPHGD